MKLADQNVFMYQGDDFALAVTIADTEQDSGLADLTGFTALTWALAKSDHAAPLIEKTSGAAEVTVVGDPTLGVVRVVLLSDDTATLKGVFRHELELIDAGGAIHTVMVGDFTILQTIIKD